jgi:transmembrane sensor
MVIAVAENEPDLLREASDWFARWDAADLSADEQRRFEAWRRQSPAHEEAFERVRRLWASPDFGSALAAVSRDCAASPDDHRPLHRRRRWWPAAATVAGLLLTSSWFFSGDLLIALQSDYRTATGEQRTIQLPDRSAIVLNTNTALASHLDGAVRRVRLLKGEALFQVQADPARPFTVEHGRHEVRVVGTEFVVRERDGALTVTVVRGVVHVVSSGAADAAVPVTAGQQISVGRGGVGPAHEVPVADVTAWTRRRLVISDTPLGEVIDEIQRYHPGYVWIGNSEIRKIRVTGIYDLSDTTETLAVLAKTLPVRLDRLTDRLLVLH